MNSDRLMNKKSNVALLPTVFHITNYKAGSQWVLAVLNSVVEERIVKPLPRVKHVTEQPINEGMVYPCVYLTRDEFFSLDLPENYRGFYVLRDLRDTLISHYFSIRYSHPILRERMLKARETLSTVEITEGLLQMIRRNWVPAEIQRSWMLSELELVIRYEDLITDQFGFFKKIFSFCEIEINDKRLQKVVDANSFERKAGRKPGEEDVNSHHRKGIVGDWRNYFDQKLTREFKERFGEVLIETGYEKDLNWQP